MGRRLVRVVTIALALIVGVAAAAVIVSQTVWFKSRLRDDIVRRVNQRVNGRVTIGRLSGNLLSGAELQDVGLSMDGSDVLSVNDVGIDYNLLQVLAHGLSIDRLHLDRPTLHLRRAGGRWNLGRLIKERHAEPGSSGRPITIKDLVITDGSIVVDGAAGLAGIDLPARIDDIDASLAFDYVQGSYSIEIANASFETSDPGIAIDALSGGITVRSDSIVVDHLVVQTAESRLTFDGTIEHDRTTPVFQMQISADPLSLPEWSAVVPSLKGIPLQPEFTLKLDGPADRLAMDLSARSSAGQLHASVVADLMAPGYSTSGTLDVKNLDLAPLAKDPALRSDITADATVDLRLGALDRLDSLGGRVEMQAPRIVVSGFDVDDAAATADIDGRLVSLDARANAYGAVVTTAGRVSLPRGSGAAFALRGEVRGLDLRRLPPGLRAPAASDLSARYDAAGVAGGPRRDVRVGARFMPSTIAGAHIGGGSTAEVTVQGPRIGYAADASFSRLDLQRIGRAFRIRTLEAARYATSLNGHVAASGEGTAPATLTADVRGALAGSAIFGGRLPQLRFEGHAASNQARVHVDGSFVDLDPAIASGQRAIGGEVDGRVAIDVRLANLSRGASADTVRGAGIVELGPSSIGDLPIERARLDAEYDGDAAGVIRSLEIAGPDLNVTAAGRFALNETGQSALDVHADSPSLETLGALVDQSVAGTLSVDAAVTGNRAGLDATGTFSGSRLRYQGTSALHASGAFTAAVRDFDVAEGRYSAKVEGTFVSIAGLQINRLTATAGYADRDLAFDVAARQPERSLHAAGDAIFHADHQEVRVNALSLESRGVAWALAPASRPTIDTAAGAITVSDLALVSGPQRIAASGTFGRPGEAMAVTLDDVDLASIDALLLEPPRFSGRLTATGSIAGTRRAPTAEAEFRVIQGGFRDFHYEQFSGSVDYTGAGFRLDTRLDQAPGVWLTARGYVPKSLFEPRSGAGPAPRAGGPTDADRVDLRIDSSPIGLGLVQSFTTALTDVTGTVEAHLRIGGSGEDPHPNGSIALKEGAFTLAATGVAYAHLRGDLLFDSDRVRIPLVSMLDADDNPLSLTGELAIHARRADIVGLDVTAHDFRILGNELGDLRLNSQLAIAGELRAPRVAGDLSVNTGRLDLDEILARTAVSAYSTTAAEHPAASDGGAGSDARTRSWLRSASADVHLYIPGDLVLKADSLQPPGSPVGIGALTVTLGGDVRASMAPDEALRIAGTIETIRGFYQFQGRQFTILRGGTIIFAGAGMLNPLLDLRAQREIRGVLANVNIRGTLRQPAIVLSSTPPLDEADILALIVFNQPVNELGAGQQVSLARRAQDLALGAAAGALEQSIGDALGIDELTIRLAPQTGAAAEVTVGEQLGQNLYVRVQQGIGEHSGTNVVLEYEITDWLRLQTNLREGSPIQPQPFQRLQGSGIDLLVFFSY
ncbi:MAG: translocation/assembly module TamB domain-containing protein [Acidobacteria bacterium]|nr:translocation/assembly module TamB domain-containing protein [Acidobacteriota bacterium]